MGHGLQDDPCRRRHRPALFHWRATDGFAPSAALIQATDGNFYGTTQYGGWPAGSGVLGFGTVFRMSRAAVVDDFDGDGKTDVTVYRPVTGQWFILQSSGNYTTFTSFTWGISSDTPVPADYDGDGKTDVAIYRPSTGAWWILQSSSNYTTVATYTWGLNTDVPVPGDYDGDGKADLAIYRPSTGMWWVLQSSSNYATFSSYAWGSSTDTPVPADYDGDGRTDVAIYRPSTGVWWILQSNSDYTTYASYAWGVSGDIPVHGKKVDLNASQIGAGFLEAARDSVEERRWFHFANRKRSSMVAVARSSGQVRAASRAGG